MEKQNIQIIEIIIDTLQEMLAEDDPRRALDFQRSDYLCGGPQGP